MQYGMNHKQNRIDNILIETEIMNIKFCDIYIYIYIYIWWLLTRTIIRAPILLTPSLRLAWVTNENIMIVHSEGLSLNAGKDTLPLVCFNFRILFKSSAKSLKVTCLNLVLRSIMSKAISRRVPWTTQFNCLAIPRNTLFSDDNIMLCPLNYSIWLSYYTTKYFMFGRL